MNFVNIVIIINQEMRIFYRVALMIFVSYVNILSGIRICIVVLADLPAKLHKSYGRQHSL